MKRKRPSGKLVLAGANELRRIIGSLSTKRVQSAPRWTPLRHPHRHRSWSTADLVVGQFCGAERVVVLYALFGFDLSSRDQVKQIFVQQLRFFIGNVVEDAGVPHHDSWLIHESPSPRGSSHMEPSVLDSVSGERTEPAR